MKTNNNIDTEIYIKIDYINDDTKEIFKEDLPLTYKKYNENTKTEHKIIDKVWNFNTLIDIFQYDIDLNIPNKVIATGNEVKILYVIS